MDVDDRKILPSPQAVFRPLDEGGVVLEVETGAYFEVNSSGRFIWETIESGPTLGELIRTVSEHYGLDLRSDVEEFVAALDERFLLASTD